MSGTTTSPWSSPHSGWHSNSKPSTEPFTPTRDSLLFGQLVNSKVDPDCFNVAFFSPDIVVDSIGRVLRVPRGNFDGMVWLARQTLTLPDTGSFRNTWRLQHEKTDRDVQRLLVRLQGEGAMKETSVYGYERGRELLQKEVHGQTLLPVVLQELFGLLLEAREGNKKEGKDTHIIHMIKTFLTVA